MPLILGKSPKSFSKNVKTEMHAGKPQDQAVAIAYSQKRKAEHMNKGGMTCPSCGYSHGGEVEDIMKEKGPHEYVHDDDYTDADDVVSRIMKKHMSEGGMVANETHRTAGQEENDFDDLVLRDDLESSYTGANSGDELGDDQEDEDRRDIVKRIMRSLSKRDRMPHPA